MAASIINNLTIVRNNYGLLQYFCKCFTNCGFYIQRKSDHLLCIKDNSRDQSVITEEDSLEKKKNINDGTSKLQFCLTSSFHWNSLLGDQITSITLSLIDKIENLLDS